jgi:hypothetical protein
MEFRPLVPKPFLASRKGAEVFDGFGHGFAIKSDNDPAERFVTMRDVEVDLYPIRVMF